MGNDFEVKTNRSSRFDTVEKIEITILKYLNQKLTRSGIHQDKQH